jgi:Family of unknown function (DUF6527)
LDLITRIRYWRRWKNSITVASVDDVPDRIPKRHAVLVGSSAFAKWLVFDCPCGRGHRVMLNLDTSHYPHWLISSKTPMTLVPSVDEVSKFGHCHYIVRDGRIRWV